MPLLTDSCPLRQNKTAFFDIFLKFFSSDTVRIFCIGQNRQFLGFYYKISHLRFSTIASTQKSRIFKENKPSDPASSKDCYDKWCPHASFQQYIPFYLLRFLLLPPCLSYNIYGFYISVPFVFSFSTPFPLKASSCIRAAFVGTLIFIQICLISFHSPIIPYTFDLVKLVLFSKEYFLQNSNNFS